MKQCIACGMPMTKPADYPLHDESKDYCVYCARPDGSMQSYPEKVKGTADFLIQTQGLDAQAAQNAAIRILAKLPAWQSCRPTSDSSNNDFRNTGISLRSDLDYNKMH